MSMSLALWLSLLLLVGNAFFVGAEFAAMAARRSTLEPLADAGSAAAQSCLAALERLSLLLATAQLGITVCSVGIGALAESALHDLLAPLAGLLPLSQVWVDAVAFGGALLLVVYLHVVVGEMIPKNLALAGPDRAALILVPPLLWLTRVLRPLVWGMEWVAKAIVRAVGVEPKDEITSAFTAHEVALIVAESHKEGLIEEGSQGLVRRALEFSDKVAADVAVPLGRLVTVSPGSTPADVERLVARQGYSRFPLVGADGTVQGYVHLKDLLSVAESDFAVPIALQGVRQMPTVAPTDEVEVALQTMARTGAHLAGVVNDAGQVTGVVFLQDAIDILVGKVRDDTRR
jgi:CBS domain containing-hemolysin-like protein